MSLHDLIMSDVFFMNPSSSRILSTLIIAIQVDRSIASFMSMFVLSLLLDIYACNTVLYMSKNNPSCNALNRFGNIIVFCFYFIVNIF